MSQALSTGKLFPADMHLMTAAFIVYVKNSILLPLDTECQYDAIMTLEGFLTFVGGAGIPHLRGKINECNVKGLLADKSLLPFICFVCVDTTLMVLSEDPEKSRSPVE